MRMSFLMLMSACLLSEPSRHAMADVAPKNMGVAFNGQTDLPEPLATDTWHSITASYRYDGKVPLLTNTYLVISRGGDLRGGFYLGYHVPTKELAIVKHGHWNATEGTGLPGESGKIIENDQGYLDCETSTVRVTDDEVVVAYRVKFKPGVLKGTYDVHQYIEDRDVRYEGFTIVGSVTIDQDVEVHRTDMPAQWSNALKPSGTPSPELLLAEGGRARYTLVIPREPLRIEQKAAGDLRQTLRLICEAEFPVVTEDQFQPGSTPWISIGRTQLLANAPGRWKGANLGAEGYGVEVVGDNLFLYGGSGRGLMHCVYALLEEDLGCRWYSLNSVDTPRTPRLSVSVVPRSYVPVLELRDPYILKMHDAAWSLRNRTNTPHARVPLAWGGSIRYHHMGHTYAAYFPTDQYFAEHPEYYALVNGKRQPSQLCHSNEEVIRLSIEKTCQIFRDRPEVTITAIGPNDGRGFCDCPHCKQLDDDNGGRSGSFFYFVNRIAEGVKQEFPNNRLISLAYLDYASPPTNLTVDDYIIIQLCTDSHAWKHQFCFVWESDEFQRILKAWQERDATIFIWDYTTNYVHYLAPMPNWPVVAENTRFFIRHGAAGIMYESEMNDLDAMRAWVWAKQLWDPALDTRTLMKDFVFGYYKEAAQPIWDWQMMMWEYWETWHRLPHSCSAPSGNPLLNNLQCSYAPDGHLFSEHFLAEMRRLVTEAEGLARSDEILGRVRRVKLPLLYLELCQELGYYSEFGDFVYGKRLEHPKADRQALQPLLDEFTALCRTHQLTTLGIPITVERITAKWQSCIDAESPAQARTFLPAEWIFRPDPEDKGVAEQWYLDAAPYESTAALTIGEETDRPLPAGLARVHINRGVGWEQQGFPGMNGYGWYFQTIRVPETFTGLEHLYLYFRAVNEQAWVYLNGEPAFERSYASTGRGVGQLSGQPFSFDAARWLTPGSTCRIAIRVKRETGLGGIAFPAMLIGTEQETPVEQLGAYRE